jgi:hypothetical protein
MAALRDLHVTANRVCGEAAQDKAKADYEIIYENSIARADGLRAAIDAPFSIDSLASTHS